MSAELLVTDTHFTASPRDAYRFELFEHLHELISEHEIRKIYFLGDITDAKDKHPETLVNLVVSSFRELSEHCEVCILAGNHDGKDPKRPYFRFLELIPTVEFIYEPLGINGDLFLPHTRQPEVDWADYDFKKYKRIFLHHTFKGARASNGMEMDGESTSIFKGSKARIYSGDIHVPQDVGPVTYVGSPYRIRFGDNFEPRVILLKDGKEESVYLPMMRKHSLKIFSPEEIRTYTELNSEDQVKITLRLPRSEFVNWAEHKRQIAEICDQLDLELCCVSLEELHQDSREAEISEPPAAALPTSDKQLFERFCEHNEIDEDLKEFGGEYLA